MSVNNAHANGGVLVYNGERILIYYDKVELKFDEMTSPLGYFKGSKKGRIYLTTHRVIFNNKEKKDSLQSFSMPFSCMKQLELEQPVFGANYVKGMVYAENTGNWEGKGQFKIWFNNGGAIEFGKALLQAAKLASQNSMHSPPPYQGPTGNFYPAAPPVYAPPQGPQYGFIPYATFPDAPPANSVYQWEHPPPYPGCDPAYPPGSQPMAPPASNAYPQGPNAYPQGPSAYPQGPNANPQGPNANPQGPNPYTQGPNPYTQGPNPYTQGPNPYTQGPNPYTQAPQGYPAAPNNYSVASNAYSQAPGPFPPPNGYQAPQAGQMPNEYSPNGYAQAPPNAYYNPTAPSNVYMPNQMTAPYQNASDKKIQ